MFPHGVGLASPHLATVKTLNVHISNLVLVRPDVEDQAGGSPDSKDEYAGRSTARSTAYCSLETVALLIFTSQAEKG